MIPYVAPMAAFLLLTAVEGYLPGVEGRPDPFWYPLAYAIKVAVVSIVAWVYRSTWRDLRPRPGPGGTAVAVVLGLIVAGAWVGLDGLYPKFGVQGGRAAFDPNVLPPATRAGFLAVRLFGLVLLVPLVEELFWRSFVIRYVIDPDFDRVPIGRVTPLAAAVSAGLFALAHPEWLPALLTGLAWAGLLRATGSVLACLISHATANLALGVYVLWAGAWAFW